MTFKTFLAEQTILEGGAAIKGSTPLTQAEARDISMHAIRDIRQALNLPSNKVAAVGSAGLKAPDQLSGDIDIAVEADVTAVKTAVEQLALDGRFKHMAGLNVYSYAKLHGSKVAQVDIIPTTNIKLAKWAYYNAPEDLKKGLKGSHRNELLFAIAKFAEYKVTAKTPAGEETGRVRLVFDLSRGLYMFTQDRTGKTGLKKNFDTVAKSLLTDDPDKICERLFGKGVQAKQVMTFDDALKLLLSPTFKHRKSLKQIIDRAISGLEGKKLAVPHELRTAVISEPPGLNESLDPTMKRAALAFQQALIDALPDSYSVKVKPGKTYFKVQIFDDSGKLIKAYDQTFDNDSMLDMHVRYAKRDIFIALAKDRGFKYQRNRYSMTIGDRLLVATAEIMTISVTTIVLGAPRFTLAYMRVKDLSQFDAALEAAKTCKLPAPNEQKVEQIFEQVEEYNMARLKKIVLEAQQVITDYGFNFKVERFLPSTERNSVSYAHALQSHFVGPVDAAWRNRVVGKVPEGFRLYMPDDEITRISDKHYELFGKYDDQSRRETGVPVAITLAVDGTGVIWFDNVSGSNNCQIIANFKVSHLDGYFDTPKAKRYVAESVKAEALELQQRLLDDLPPGFDIKIKTTSDGQKLGELLINFHDLSQLECDLFIIDEHLVIYSKWKGKRLVFTYHRSYDQFLRRVKEMFEDVTGSWFR